MFSSLLTNFQPLLLDVFISLFFFFFFTYKKGSLAPLSAPKLYIMSLHSINIYYYPKKIKTKHLVLGAFASCLSNDILFHPTCSPLNNLLCWSLSLASLTASIHLCYSDFSPLFLDKSHFVLFFPFQMKIALETNHNSALSINCMKPPSQGKWWNKGICWSPSLHSIQKH